jgi:putative ABC transport system ATP-binding protein
MILQGVSREKRRRRVMELLQMVGLEDKADTRPTKLSGGQKQRVAVARAMAAGPNIILADEPTANLDSTTSGELLDMMRRLNRDTGMTFIFSTHDTLVMQRAERLLTLRDGKITADETGSEKSIPEPGGEEERGGDEG